MLDSVRIVVVVELSWSFLHVSELVPNEIQCEANNVKACGSFGARHDCSKNCALGDLVF